MAFKDRERTGSWVMLSPWIVIAAATILVPIVILMTFFSIEKQREAMTGLLAEKGAALIRSIEAGGRTGVPGRDDLWQKLQALLVETAQQPDIRYLVITDLNGLIMAHNSPRRIGAFHGRELDLREIAATGALFYRNIPDSPEGNIFEVFRYYSAPPDLPGAAPERPIPDDLFRRDYPPHGGLMIFVGLDREPVASVLQSDIRVTVTLAVILMLLGLTGIISLLVAQAYRQARASLSLARAFSDNLLEYVPIGIIATNSSGAITSFNQVAASILQAPLESVWGKAARTVLPSPLVAFLDLLKENDGAIEVEITCPLPDNRSIALDVIATRLREEATFIGSVLIIRDLTEVKRLQKEIDRSQRLASLGRMAAGVAHEIRNPLSSIKGFATYFRDRYRDIPEDEKIAGIMIEEVDRLNRVVGQLLDFSRPVRPGNALTPMGSVIRRALEMASPRAEERQVTIETDLENETREMPLDDDGLRQALLNLYINAIEAMPRGGRLTVRLRHDDEGSARISVADSGQGISAEDLPRIFEPYFTTKPSGTGLGLAIVHKIVEAHDGILSVESQPGCGTVVTVTIPDKRTER